MILQFVYRMQLLLVLYGVCMFIKCINGDCTEGELRLLDGDEKIHDRGRVEIYHHNKWGTVCDDFWDMNDGNVVCRQLGFKGAVAVFSSAVYGAGSGRTWLDNVRCEGNEDSLSECPNNGWGSHNCAIDHSEDAAVECQVNAAKDDLRLLDEDGGDQSQGYVQIFDGQSWITLCGEQWGITESLVACRQLGFVAATSYITQTPLSVMPNATNLHSDLYEAHEVNCSGYEHSIASCLTSPVSFYRGLASCEDGIYVKCTKTLDSVTDEYYNPDTYNWTDWFSTGSDQLRGRQATIDTLKTSFEVCGSDIPADIECRSQYDTAVTCDRRKGLICNRTESQDCDNYEVRLLCLLPIYDTYTSATCIYDGQQYKPGEVRRGDKPCIGCTCLDNGNWTCDFQVNFCLPSPPTCDRPCDGKPRTCLIDDWVVEWFYGGAESQFCQGCLFPAGDPALLETNGTTCPNCVTLDGVPRTIAVVNRKLPGPAIQVCEDDTIIVKVINKMKNDPATGTSIHWHGMFMNGTQYMDGAFMVTQCPIPIGEAFVYNFKAHPHGTHWWHSHAGLQRGDGVAGALIVRKMDDPNKDAYDEDRKDHVVIVNDWSHQLGVSEFNGQVYGSSDREPNSILINGRGGQLADTDHRPDWCKDTNGNYAECPVPRYEQFNVVKGRRFRFRMISTATYEACAIRVSIDQHNITIIATDGASVQPYPCKSFIIFNAERYDFVLNADQEEGNYWMRVKGEQGCGRVEAIAIIHYNSSNIGVPQSNDDSANGTTVDSCDIDNDGTTPLYQLDASTAEPSWEGPDVTYYIEMGSRSQVDNGKMLNNVTFRIPSRPFLLQYKSSVEKEEICNLENREEEGGGGHMNEMKICGDGMCDCSHVIHVPLNKVVELFFVNKGRGTCHPIHLHGFNYRVVAQEQFQEDIYCSAEYVKELNAQGNITRKPVSKAIKKDTMVPPKNGYTAVQFRADNPGWWFLHCHFEIHLSLGMALVVHVGNDEDHLPPIPKDFPSCGNWPVDRRGEAEVFGWSDELLGNLKTEKGNPFFQAVVEKVEKTKDLIATIQHRDITTFDVLSHRIKTNPITWDIGFHAYLFKVDTGDNRYAHLYFIARAERLFPQEDFNPKPRLLACYLDQQAESSLFPLKVVSEENRCLFKFVY